jgi:tripartite-type tricarboxylate transporter receptor subunit TctC
MSLTLRFASLMLLIVGAGAVWGQDFPTRPVRIVTGSVGGTADVTARLIGQKLTGALGQPVVVDNRQSNLLKKIVATAPPDGYVLLLGGSVTWLSSLSSDSNSVDPFKELAPITLATTQPLIVVVHPSVPVSSLGDLIALARSKPGQLNYSAGSLTADLATLGTELFKSTAGVDIVRISYKGSGPALNGLLGGEVQVLFANGSSVVPEVKAGKLKALAVSSAQPTPLFPGMPTVASSGLPGYELVQSLAMFAPAKTPEAIIRRLNQEIVRALNDPETRKLIFNGGAEVVASSPEELTEVMKTEVARMRKVVQDTGLRIE